MKNFSIIILLLISAILIASQTTIYMGIASFAFFLMVYGFNNRKNHLLHAKLMVSTIVLDLTLVLVLQIQRHAVQTAVSFTLSPLQQIHILVSTIAVILYFPMIYLGRKNLMGIANQSERKWHRRLGYITFIFRTLGFITMFSQLSHVKGL